MAKIQFKESVRLKGETHWQQLYQGLNARQREAVDAIEGPVMVLAGPGTGKTQVLTMRVANILRQTDMAPWNILCLTFTESAASTMRQRLLTIMGEAAYQVRISTFHAFCNDVLQEWPEKFSLGADEPLADVERVELFRQLIDELPARSPLKPFGQPYLFVPDVMRAVRLLKQEGVGAEKARRALQQCREFLQRSAPTREEFIKLKPSERNAAVIKIWRERLLDEATSPALREIIDHMFGRFAAALASDKGEAGKAATRLKNNLKRLLDKWERQAPRQADLLAVYEAYQARLADRGRYDFEDMIMKVSQALRHDDELLAHYQEQFQYVLVDEFQDTNGSQNETVQRLGSFYSNPNIFVVGDDKQSIFRFQGASLENLLNFYAHYQGEVKVVSLKENYRSGQLLLDAAQAVIANNQELIVRHLPGLTDELAAQPNATGNKLVQYEFDTEDEENYFVATKIEELLAGGVDPSEIAVLYRFNADAQSLHELLLRLKVPVQLEAGENVLEDIRVKQLLELMQFLAGPWHSEALAVILQFDFLELPTLDTLRVINFAGGERDLFSVLGNEGSLNAAGVSAKAPFMDLAAKLAKWQRRSINATLTQFFDELLQESGLLNYVLKRENSLPVLHRLTVLYQELTKLNRSKHNLTIADFADRLGLLKDAGLTLAAVPWQTRKAAVRLLTVHKAKGMEFEHVFVMRLRDKHWGNLRERARVDPPPGLLKHDPVQGQANNEDERRLFYVALTRAKQRLYLSYARSDAGGREFVKSQFLREIPDGIIENVDTAPPEAAVLKRLTIMRLTPQAEVPADVREWLAGKLDNYVMSVTHLNNYLRCPRLFYFRNLIRVPAAKSKHMVLGTAVHAALRDFFGRLKKTGQVPEAEYLQQQLAHYLKNEVLTPKDKNDSLLIGREALAAWWQHYHQDFRPDVITEYDFRAHRVQLVDLRLTGKIDKIETTDVQAGKVTVIDYKTGNPDNAARHLNGLGDYRRQLVFYKLLGDLAARFPYEITRGEIDFVQASRRTGKFVKKSFELTSQDTLELTKQIKQVWAEIKNLKFLEPEAACGKCEYCERLN